MTDTEPTGSLPEAVVKEKRRLSAVWIVPIVALVVGAWLTYKSVSEQGPTFTITFASAEGLEAGKTKIKYRDLEMGVVETLVLSDDLSQVTATARIAPTYARFLTENTRFWVVRARVSAGQVSGLSTLLSGAYIGIDPIAEGPKSRAFEGLATGPLITSREAGTRFRLRSDKMGSLEVGVPILYRQVRVGEVVRSQLEPDGKSVAVDVFVHAPHDKRVRTTSRWWNASGFNASINQNGLRIETESFVTMAIGGVAFDTPDDDPGEQVEPQTEFHLYPNKAATEEPVYQLKFRFLTYFDGSVKGLAKGSAVEFRGIPVGQVVSVNLEYNPTSGAVRIPVVLEVEPERVTLVGGLGPLPHKQADVLVERGLRARLESGNLLTGALVVALDFFPDAKPAKLVIAEGAAYPELPTMPKRLDELAANVRKLVDKLEDVPMDEMGREIAGALRALRGTLEQTRAAGRQTNKEVLPALTKTMDEAQATLRTVQRTLAAAEDTARTAGNMVAPTSPINTELTRLMSEMTDALRSVRLLAEQLDRSPEVLLMGREEP